MGSQGALGLITEVTYEVFPVARDQALALLPVPDIATAAHLLGQLRARFDRDGQAVELFEIVARETLHAAVAHAGQGLRDDVANAPYYVLLAVVSDTASAPSAFGSAFVEEVAGFLMGEALGRDGAPLYAEGGFDFDHAPARLLRVREACSDMSRLLPKQSYDVVVPVAQLDGFVTDLEREGRRAHPAFRLNLFGHGGVGALHLHAVAPDAGTLERERAALDTLVFDLVQHRGGSPWAEHGVGRKRGREWQRRTPRSVQEEMLRLKRRRDPDNVVGSRLFGFHRLLKETGAGRDSAGTDGRPRLHWPARARRPVGAVQPTPRGRRRPTSPIPPASRPPRPRPGRGGARAATAPPARRRWRNCPRSATPGWPPGPTQRTSPRLRPGRRLWSGGSRRRYRPRYGQEVLIAERARADEAPGDEGVGGARRRRRPTRQLHRHAGWAPFSVAS